MKALLPRVLVSDLEPRPTNDEYCVELHSPTTMSSGIKHGSWDRSEAKVEAEAEQLHCCFEVDSVFLLANQESLKNYDFRYQNIAGTMHAPVNKKMTHT